jgi:serine/threonine-protein kinase
MGTQGYMSPEQIAGKKLALASDLYAIGLVMVDTITLSGHHRCQLQRNGTSLPPSALIRCVHQAHGEAARMFGKVISKCLAEDPRKRYQSCDELRQALNHAYHRKDNRALVCLKTFALIAKIPLPERIIITLVIILFFLYLIAQHMDF